MFTLLATQGEQLWQVASKGKGFIEGMGKTVIARTKIISSIESIQQNELGIGREEENGCCVGGDNF